MGRARRLRYRHLRRTVIAVPAAVALILLLALAARHLLESRALRQRVMGWLETDVAAAAGVDLEIGDLRWKVVPPRMVLEGARLQGAGVEAEVDRLVVDLAGVRWLRRTLILDTVAAHGLELRLTETPRRRRREAPFRVLIRHLELQEVAVQDLQAGRSLQLDLAGVSGSWTADEGGTVGWVRLGRVRVRGRGLEPFDLAAEGRLEMGETVAIPAWRVTGDGLSLAGQGALAEGRLRLAGEGELDLGELDRVVRARDRLEGEVRVQVDLDTGRSELLVVESSASRVSAAGFPLQDVGGRLVLTADRAWGELSRARLLGGRLEGRWSMRRGGRPRPHRVEATVRGMRLAPFLSTLGVPPADLAARTDVDAELEWYDAAVRTGRGEAVAVLSAGREGLPVAGEVRVRLEPTGLLHFSADGLELGRSRVRWQGPLALGSWEPSWSVIADPAELGELVPLANAWIGRRVLPEGVAGRGELQVDLAGSWRRPTVGIRLEAHPLEWRPLVFDRVVAEAQVAGSTLEVEAARFRVGEGSGEVDGVLRWGDEPGVDLDWRGRSIPLAEVGAWLELEEAISGSVAFTGGLRGPLDDLRGSWAVGITDAAILGRPAGDGSGGIDLADGRFTLRGLEFSGGLAGELWWQVADGSTGGRVRWPDLPLEGVDPILVSLLSGRASLAGDFLVPPSGQVQGRMRVEGRGAWAEVEAESRRVRVSLEISDAVAAELGLEREADGGLHGDGRLWLLAAEELLARLAPRAGVPLEGQGEATLQVDWPAGGWPRLEGSVRRLQLALDDRPLELLEPAAFTLSRSGLEVAGLHADLLGEEVFLRGRVGAGGELQGNLSGTLDALLLRFLLPDWEPAGRVTGLLELLGTVERPLVEGVAEARQVSFRLPGSRDVVAGVDGVLLLSSDHMELDGVDFRFSGGSGQARGEVGWSGDEIHLDLAGTVAGAEVELLPGLAPELAGAWRLEGPTGSLELSGDLVVERATLDRSDDVTGILLDWLEAGHGGAPSRGGGLRLDLRVTAEDSIEARTPFLHLTGSAELEVGGTTANPGLVGSLELEEGGEFTFQGVRYELERGVLTFTDPLQIDPVIDLEARAWIQSYMVTLRLNGTLDRLVPTVTSDPPLPEAEVYSLMALGFRDETLGSGAMGVGLASSVLTREINAELQRRASTLLPVDQLRVDPFAESSTGNPTARVTAVTQISPRWTLILQSNLSANREEVAVSRWFLGPGLFLEATREADGTYALDLKLRRRY